VRLRECWARLLLRGSFRGARNVWQVPTAPSEKCLASSSGEARASSGGGRAGDREKPCQTGPCSEAHGFYTGFVSE